MNSRSFPSETIALQQSPARFSATIGIPLRANNPMHLDGAIFEIFTGLSDVEKLDIVVGRVRDGAKPVEFLNWVSCHLSVRARAVISEGDRMVELTSVSEIRELRDGLTKLLEHVDVAVEKAKLSDALETMEPVVKTEV